MFSWLQRRREPTIGSFTFDATGWVDHGEQTPAAVHVWETPEGDAVSVHFFRITPDLPKVRTAADLRGFYDRGVKTSGAQVVECSVTRLAGLRSVNLMLKFPQKPMGRTYQAAITVPFRNHSFVIKVQCPERGTTGVREAVLADRHLSRGEVPKVGGPGPIFSGWDPDSAAHDGDFPAHPVSRLRRHLRRIASSAKWDSTVTRLPAFPLPVR